MSRIVEMILAVYRRAPSGRAFVLAAVASLCLATTSGSRVALRRRISRPGKQQR